MYVINHGDEIKMMESWVIFALVIVAALLLQYDRGGGDVVEVSRNWEQLISLPRKPPTRIAVGYCKQYRWPAITRVLCQVERQSGFDCIWYEPAEGVRTRAQ